MRRFFVPAGTLGTPEIRLEGEIAHRLARVLRLKHGDRVVLSEGGATEYEVQLKDMSARAITATVTAERAAPAEPSVNLVLYQSLIRANRFDLVLEKGTEIGVSRFVPLVPARGQIQDGNPSENRLERWRRVIVEAAEQSGRGRPPQIVAPMRFEDAVGSAEGIRLLPYEGERGQALGAYLRTLEQKPDIVSIFVGPEGGFETAEVDLARDLGLTLVTLGPRILRSETAGIVATAIALEALGEMG
jgi:16S rRNA (uracil1498-N3)-methyltransferase